MECREKPKLILSLWGFKAGVEAEATDWEDCRLSLVCFSTEERKIAWHKASWTEHSIRSYCGALRGGPLFFCSGVGWGLECPKSEGSGTHLGTGDSSCVAADQQRLPGMSAFRDLGWPHSAFLWPSVWSSGQQNTLWEADRGESVAVKISCPRKLWSQDTGDPGFRQDLHEVTTNP